MDIEDDKKGAAVKFPPPLIFLFFMLVAGSFQYFWPTYISSSLILKFLGGGIILIGLTAVIMVSRAFKRVDTNIEPWKPTSKIVSTGIFAYSRNPVYTAFCLAPIGVGLLLNSVWVLTSFIPAAYVVYYVAIKKEEVYLEQKFGDEYLSYKNKVRRWM